jgi:spectinomycin phosphotransferase
MIYDGKFRSEALIPVISTAYGIDIDHIDFLFSGWGGYCYKITAGSDSQYFLKLNDPDTDDGVAVSSKDFYLPLMDQLHRKGILPDIPHPIPTLDGNFYLNIESQKIVVTNFIEGECIGYGKLSAGIITEMAGMVGILHSSTPDLIFDHPFIESFKTGFIPMLVEHFGRLETTTNFDCPGILLLQDTLLPWKTNLFKTIKRLSDLQSQVRTKNPIMVVCHTDLHGGNLMRDKNGILYLLDWENAMIAPREQDMIFFLGDTDYRELFWTIYLSHVGKVEIDPTILAFYFFRRAMEDVAGFVFRIMRGDGTEDRDQQDIKWLLETMDNIPKIDGVVEEIIDFVSRS